MCLAAQLCQVLHHLYHVPVQETRRLNHLFHFNSEITNLDKVKCWIKDIQVVEFPTRVLAMHVSVATLCRKNAHSNGRNRTVCYVSRKQNDRRDY